MNKKKIITITSIILILIAIIGGIAFINPSNNSNISEDIFYKGDGIEMTQDRLNEMINHMNGHKEVIIYYSIYEDIYDKQNNFIERKYDTKISSKINLKNKTEETYNSILLSDEDGNSNLSQVSLKEATIDFKDFFGINYENCNGIYELMCQLAKTQNTDHSLFINSKLDTAYYDIFYNEYGQKHYIFKNEDILTNSNIKNKIINVSSRIILEDHGGQEFISTIENVITYKEGKNEVDKIFVINIELQETDADTDCSCASDTDCNTGEDNGVDCGEDSDC